MARLLFCCFVLVLPGQLAQARPGGSSPSADAEKPRPQLFKVRDVRAGCNGPSQVSRYFCGRQNPPSPQAARGAALGRPAHRTHRTPASSRPPPTGSERAIAPGGKPDNQSQYMVSHPTSGRETALVICPPRCGNGKSLSFRQNTFTPSSAGAECWHHRQRTSAHRTSRPLSVQAGVKQLVQLSIPYMLPVRNTS